jgi:hypothetical protein
MKNASWVAIIGLFYDTRSIQTVWLTKDESENLTRIFDNVGFLDET